MSNPLNEMSPAERGRIYPIQVVAHNPEWKDIFTTEKHTLENMLDKSELASIEHIGSTSIPGLSAKPIIDILLQVNKSAD